MTTEAVVYTEQGVERFEDVRTAAETSGTTWVRVYDPSDGELGVVSEVFGIHPLSIEDVQNNVRPKTEEFDAHTFVLLKTARLRRGETTFTEELDDRPVGCFIGTDWLVTLTGDQVDAVDAAWRTVHAEDARMLRRGPDFAAYRVIDEIVDEYFGLLDRLESRIERIEEDVVAAPDIGTLEEINAVRRELLSVRKLLWPSREAVGVLARGDPEPVQEATEKYYRDVYDHLVQLVDLAETYRELTTGARDIYLNSLSISTNEVMKTLTVIATLVLPLTFVAGVYGMNFEPGASPYNMPELGWAFGYPAVMLGMMGVTVVLLAYFRREGWL